MFQGADLPGIYNLSSLVDRTFYVFRHRAFSYLWITLCTFGIGSLGIAWAYIGDVPADAVSLYRRGPEGMVALVQRYYYFLAIPGIVADLALQEYTTHLVRNREIPWIHAIGKSFSLKLFQYAMVRVVGMGIVYLISSATQGITAAAGIGTLIYALLVTGAYSVFVGMAHAIVVEERKNFFNVIGRNLNFAFSNVGLSVLGAFAGFLILSALMACCMIFLLVVGMIVLTLLYGSAFNPLNQQEVFNTLLNVFLFIFPVLLSLFYVPLSNIFYSLMYYHFRTKKEGFHLENKLNLKLREMEK